MKEKFSYNLEKVSTVRVQLIAVFSILFAVTFAIISLISYNVSRSIITKDIDIQTQEVVNGHAAEIDQWITRMFSVMNAYAHLIERGLPDDRSISSDILGIYGKESFSDLYYGSVTGNFISGKKWKPPAGYDPRIRPWYMEAVNKRKTIITDVYLDFETNSLNVSVSSPVYSRNGSLRGVLSADLLLKTLEDKLKDIRVKGMGYAVLIDNRGVALAHPDRTFTGRNLIDNHELRDVIKSILEKKQGKVDYNTENNKVAVFTPIPSCGWILGIILTKEEIYSDLKLLALKFSLIFLVSLVIVVLTSKYFAGKLTYFMYLLEQTVESRTAELKEKIAEVEYLSLTDPLTGISNRRKIETVLKSEIERTSRTGNPLAVIMVDIDHFKEFNDTYGHETGDRILKEFADTVSRSIRAIDVAGRIGGEEFLIVCPETSVTGAYLVAEKLRIAVESMKIQSVQRVTASFGCAALIQGEDWNHLISRSDKALYRAKENGRNRVESDI
jgi:diguanylate cyclase (GGDEF)-like protein